MNQNDTYQNEMKLKARETFELCTHFNIPTSSINFTDMTCNNSFLNTMKCYHDGLQLNVQSAKDELECCRGELTRVTADHQVSEREEIGVLGLFVFDIRSSKQHCPLFYTYYYHYLFVCRLHWRQSQPRNVTCPSW